MLPGHYKRENDPLPSSQKEHSLQLYVLEGLAISKLSNLFDMASRYLHIIHALEY